MDPRERDINLHNYLENICYNPHILLVFENIQLNVGRLNIPLYIPLFRIIEISLEFRKLIEVTPADLHLPVQALLLQPAAEFDSLPSVLFP